MKSPFPGMDPYLESHWLDVHSSLVTSARDALNEQLPDDLVASVEERIAVESEGGTDRMISPDVRVFEPGSQGPSFVDAPSGLVEAPYRLVAAIEPVTERFLRIVEAGTERLVTVIEFLSPTNKQGDGLRAFRQKRAELLSAGVNFVEVDLARSGDWRALLRPHRPPEDAITPYRVTFRVAIEPGAAYLQPIALADPLPEITIPLRKRDPRVRMELQRLVDHAYTSGRYHRRLDYSKPCDPSLEPANSAWADDLLRAAGKR